MNKIKQIAIIGLGQIGNYLYHTLTQKKKLIENKYGKKIKTGWAKVARKNGIKISINGLN